MSANNEQCTQKRNSLNDENNGTDDILKQTLNDSTTDSTQHSSDQTHPGAPVQRDQKDEAAESVVEQEFSFIAKAEDGSIQDSTDPGLKITTSVSTGDAVEGPVPVASAVRVESVGLTTTSTAMDPPVSSSTDVDNSLNPHAPENPNNLHKTQEDCEFHLQLILFVCVYWFYFRCYGRAV